MDSDPTLNLTLIPQLPSSGSGIPIPQLPVNHQQQHININPHQQHTPVHHQHHHQSQQQHQQHQQSQQQQQQQQQQPQSNNSPLSPIGPNGPNGAYICRHKCCPNVVECQQPVSSSQLRVKHERSKKLHPVCSNKYGCFQFMYIKYHPCRHTCGCTDKVRGEQLRHHEKSPSHVDKCNPNCPLFNTDHLTGIQIKAKIARLAKHGNDSEAAAASDEELGEEHQLNTSTGGDGGGGSLSSDESSIGSDNNNNSQSQSNQKSTRSSTRSAQKSSAHSAHNTHNNNNNNNNSSSNSKVKRESKSQSSFNNNEPLQQHLLQQIMQYSNIPQSNNLNHNSSAVAAVAAASAAASASGSPLPPLDQSIDTVNPIQQLLTQVQCERVAHNRTALELVELKHQLNQTQNMLKYEKNAHQETRRQLDEALNNNHNNSNKKQKLESTTTGTGTGTATIINNNPDPSLSVNATSMPV